MIVCSWGSDSFNVGEILLKGSLDEKLPIYEQDPKSKRLDSFEKRFVRDYIRSRRDS